MGRPGISYEKIVEAAEELIKEGVSPTINEVRRLIGTGSNSTIAKHLKAFFAKRPANATELILPEKLLMEIRGALADKERATRIEASSDLARLHEDNETLSVELEEQQEEIDRLSRQLDDARKERDVLAGKLQQMHNSNETSSAELASARHERDRATQDAATARAALNEAIGYREEAKASQTAEKTALARAALFEGHLEELRRATCSTANDGSPNTPSASQSRIATASLSDLALVIRTSLRT
jgi:chromosome segregation ATPase